MTEDSELWTSGERFVAYLDILGFKDMLAKERDKGDVFKELKALFDIVARAKIQNESSDGNLLRVFNFSDSFCIFSIDSNEKSFYSFTLRCREIMAVAADKNLSLKGAIAFGHIDIDVASRIFVGQPMVDAVLLQENLHYIGVVVHHSAQKFMTASPEISQSYQEKIALRYFDSLTPFKFGEVAHWNLNWFNAYTFLKKDSTNNKHDYENLREKIQHLRSLTSGLPRKYHENTLVMIDRWLKKKQHQ